MPNNPANPRPKRGADDWTRTHHQQNEGSSPKKARFDLRNPSALAPDASDGEEEDAFLEADELAKPGNQVRRNAVNIDGFESDSSNEGFDARVEAKAKAKREAEKAAKSKDEESNDMFADLEEDLVPDGDEDEDLNREGKKSKKVKFADLDQVADLQENLHSKSGGHVSANLHGETEEVESSSESEVGDQIRAEVDGEMDTELGAGSKKKHAPKLDAFNLNAEKEDGKFDESLNFVRKAADPEAVYDNWIEGTSKKDMRKAKEAHDKRDRELRQKNREDDSILSVDALSNLICHLERGETSLEALARLAPKKGAKKARWQNKKSKDRSGEMHIDKPVETREEVSRRNAVEAITGASDALMARGIIDINDTREMLTRHYKKETGEDWKEPTASATARDVLGAQMWEFRWTNAASGDVHGPEPHEKMKAWYDAGYFAGDVQFRPSGSEQPWQTNVTF